MKKRVLSLLMAFALCFTMLPTAAFAELADAAAVKTQSSEKTADAYTIGDDTVVQDEEIPDTAVQAAQALIDALPDEMTADNAEELEKQLMALDAALEALTDEQLAQLDMTRYEALCAAMTALTAEQAEEHSHPICGDADCTESDHQLSNGASWQPISTAAELTGISAAGYYYLTASVELTTQWEPVNDVVLCLNGYSITAAGDFDVISVATSSHTFTLCDCKNTGSITHATNNTGRGVLVGGTFNMYGGSITGNSASGSGYGGGVSVSSGTFYMYGGSITRNTASGSSCGGGVYVDSGSSTFTMSGGEITGNDAETGGGVFVNSNGSFTVSGDAKITTNTASSFGGGVFVDGGGTFNMNGGEITGNNAKDNGGGVYVGGYGNGTFTMSGGSIGGSGAAANTAKNGGGVYVDKGAFTMSGGSVTGNSASNNGGGVFVASQGKFTMSVTAAITGNTATSFGGGVYVDDGAFTMSGGSIGGETGDANTANNGGGVYVSGGTFTMSSGEIAGNSASSFGGGVFVYDTFTMSGGSITGNTATGGNGGGVYVATSSTFTMSGSAAITGNTASTGNTTSSYGGGVYVSSGGTFNMASGSITGNTVTGGNGGGVGMGGGTFTMSGGSITGNTATSGNSTTSGDGGGVYVNGTFSISGAPSITGNTGADNAANNLYLGSISNNTITVTGELTGGDGSIGVTTGTKIGENATVSVAVGGGTYSLTEDDAKKFRADSSIYETVYDASSASSGTVVIREKPHKHRVCGETGCTDASHTEVSFRPLTKSGLGTKQTSGASLSNVGAHYDLSEGNYYLTEDFTTDATIRIAGDVTLCLNGHSITVANAAGVTCAILIDGDNASLTLCDCREGSTEYGKITTNFKGRGVSLWNGSFTMYGGSIAENGAAEGSNSGYGGAGVCVESGKTFTMYGGEITGNNSNIDNGGGVLVGGTFNLYGGSISGNTAKYGGGVYVKNGTFNMSGGKVTGNTASEDGGGVRLDKGTFNMSGSAVISRNTANDNGGGVDANNGTFNMSGGSITGNNATGDTSMRYGGGGVNVYDNGTFTMTGGSITGNNTTGCGGGVEFIGSGTMTVSGSVQITNNWQNGTLNSTSGLYEQRVSGKANNLYLDSTKTVAIDNLAEDARIGVNTADDPSVKIATGATEELDYTAIFKPDAEEADYEITKNTDDSTLYLSVHVHAWAYTADDTTHTITAQCSKCHWDGGSVTLKAPDESTLTYDGNGKAATVDNKLTTGDTDPAIRYTQTTPTLQALENGAVPTNAHTYTASISLGDAEVSVEYTINKATPTAADFDFSAPGNLIYSGEVKTASVEAKSDIVGMGDVTVRYYQGENKVEPKNAGDYTVKIDVAEGTNYAAATGLTANEWKFSISRAKLTLTADDFTFKAADNLIYNGEPKTAEVTWKEASKATGFGAITVKYYAENGAKVNEPTEAGIYTVRIDVAQGDGCEAQNDIYSDSWSFTIKQVQQRLTFTSSNVNKMYGEGTFTNPIQETGIQGAIIYTSSNTDVATVDANGTVTILAASTEAVTITASTEGTNNYSRATASYTLTVAKKAITVSGITAENKTYDGTADATLDYSEASFVGKLDSDELTVTATGEFADKNAGTGKTVSISKMTLGGASAGNYTLATSGQQTTASASISPAEICFENAVIAEKIYDGTANATITKVTITGLRGGDTLTRDTDYTVSSSPYMDATTDQESAEAGVEAKMLNVTVTLADSVKNYTFGDGSKSSSQKISDLTIKQATPEITAEVSRTITKNGMAVDISGWATFNNTDSGAKLTYTLNGAPAGITLEDNKLKAADDTSTVSSFNIKVNAEATANFTAPAEKIITVTVANKLTPALDGDLTLTPAEITYGQKLSEITITGTMKVDGKTVAGTFTWDAPSATPDAQNSYQADWTFTPNDTQRYLEAHGTATIDIAPRAITGAVITLGDSLTYNGGAQTQTVTSVKLGALDVTYTVSGSTATNAGEYTLTVTGTGNFTGTAKKGFTVAPKSIADAAVSAADAVYTGKAQTPAVTSVTVDGLTLTAADYTVVSRGAVSVGDYQFTLTGKGNFTGTAQGTFTVTKAAALTVQDIRLDVTNNYAAEYTADLYAALEKALPEGSRLGAVRYGAPQFADDKGYCDAAQAAISPNGVLTLPVKAVNTTAEGEAARVTVIVECGNFENTAVTVVLYAANKPVPTGTPTASRTTLTYGEALNSITLSGRMTSGGENVPGKFAWKEPNLRPAAGELSAVWVFTPDDGKYAAVTGTIRLTVSEPVVPTYTVGGKVTTYSLTDPTAPQQPADDAIVTIRKGVEILGGQKRTDEHGAFSLDGVPAGVYNVVVEHQGKTVTQKVEITDHNVTDFTVAIPLEDVNSKLDIKDSGGITEDLVVGGLEQEANDWFQDGDTAPGGSVDVKMEIESKPENKDDTEQSAIREKAKDKVMDFIDMGLSLVRDGAEKRLPETKNVLEIIISYDTSRAGITVIRHHDGQVDTFTRLDSLTPGQDMTFYADEANKCIHIFTNRFSTYAIGYEPAGSSGGSSGGVYASGGNSSPATGDAGLLPYAAMALTGCTGMALTLRRKRRED